MAMKEESTEVVLNKILGSKNLDEVSEILADSKAKLNMSFQDFFNKYLLENPNLRTPDIIRDSNIDGTYARQMLNGRKKNPGRDYVIALCYAARMNKDEVNHALIYSKNTQLYAKNDRDAHLIFLFSKNKKDKRVTVTDLDDALISRELEPLKISKDSN